VRRCRHQQEIPRPGSQQLPQFVSLRLLYFAAKIGRRHSVRFVANDEVPIRRRLQFGLQLGRTRGHVEPHDETILFNEWIASDGSFNLITGQDVEAEAKFLGHLVLPTRLPGATIRQRSRSPRIRSSLTSSPAMTVLPAPGSSASRKRSG
jgi:hypothetical protein